jgi:hypothetical protein
MVKITEAEIAELAAWRAKQSALREKLKALGDDDPARPHVAKQRKLLEAQYAHVQRRILDLNQGNLL